MLHGQRDDFIRRAVHRCTSKRRRTAGRTSAQSRKSGKLPSCRWWTTRRSPPTSRSRASSSAATPNFEEALRELRTYTSALVGDVNTARDTNPLRPEVWVRAVLAAARSLPIARNLRNRPVALLPAQPLMRAIHDTLRGRLCAFARRRVSRRPRTAQVVNEGVVTELTDAMRARRSLDPSAQARWLR